MKIGTPYKSNASKVLLLGSGELGKELTIELMRLGIEVIACDRYEHAPAMQVAHRAHVFDMQDEATLRKVIFQEKPQWVVPEIEAIATQALVKIEQEYPEITIVPTARAAYLTMNREGIRRLAAEELNLPTAAYRFAETLEEFKAACQQLGFPCLVKPIMSSSGKGQALIKTAEQIDSAWQHSQSAGRSGKGKVIVEAFVPFESEITLLTVRAVNGTFFCAPIGHKQVDGDYVESWQPHAMSAIQLAKAQAIAEKITANLGGFGLFGVELFLLPNDEVYFSEVSPRPHDTGMVTMATQWQSEFALHAKAILGLPVHSVENYTAGASIAIRAKNISHLPFIDRVETILTEEGLDFRYFGKPESHTNRRMGVILAQAGTVEQALSKARLALAGCVLT